MQSPREGSELMKVSVVIPVYNVEDYIGRCLDSVLCQTHTNFEIIVVDDCSPDGSIDIVKRYGLEKVKIVHHEENRGLSASRNTGVKYCEGDYLLFLDSDDYLAPHALSRCVETALKHDSDVVSFNSCHVDERGRVWDNIWKSRYNYTDCFNISINQYPRLVWDVAAWNKLIRLKLYRELDLAFDEKQRWFEDHLFSLQLYSGTDKVSIINEVLHYYFKRSDQGNQSITQQKTFQSCHYRMRMLEQVLAYLEQEERSGLIPYFFELLVSFYKHLLRDAFKAASSKTEFIDILDRFRWVCSHISSDTLRHHSLESLDLMLSVLHLEPVEVVGYFDRGHGRLKVLNKLFDMDFECKEQFLPEYLHLREVLLKGDPLEAGWMSHLAFVLSQPSHLIRDMFAHGVISPLGFVRYNLAIYTIEKSGAFDLAYYARQCSMEFTSLREAVLHYVFHGENIGMRPNNEFSATYYVEANYDLRSWKGNMFAHYLRHGLKKGRVPRLDLASRRLNSINILRTRPR